MCKPSYLARNNSPLIANLIARDTKLHIDRLASYHLSVIPYTTHLLYLQSAGTAEPSAHGRVVLASMPKPRLAKAFQRRHLLAPLYRFWSAWIQASRALATICIIADQRVIIAYEDDAQHTGRVAGLDGKRVDEQMQEDDVSFGTTWVGLSSGGEPVFFD